MCTSNTNTHKQHIVDLALAALPAEKMLLNQTALVAHIEVHQIVEPGHKPLLFQLLALGPPKLIGNAVAELVNAVSTA